MHHASHDEARAARSAMPAACHAVPGMLQRSPGLRVASSTSHRLGLPCCRVAAGARTPTSTSPCTACGRRPGAGSTASLSSTWMCTRCNRNGHVRKCEEERRSSRADLQPPAPSRAAGQWHRALQAALWGPALLHRGLLQCEPGFGGRTCGHGCIIRQQQTKESRRLPLHHCSCRWELTHGTTRQRRWAGTVHCLRLSSFPSMPCCCCIACCVLPLDWDPRKLATFLNPLRPACTRPPAGHQRAAGAAQRGGGRRVLGGGQQRAAAGVFRVPAPACALQRRHRHPVRHVERGEGCPQGCCRFRGFGTVLLD